MPPQNRACRIPFAQLPATVQQIIGTEADIATDRPGREWTLRQVWQGQRLNNSFGRLTIEGKTARTLRFNHMELRRVERAIKAIERDGAFRPEFAGNFPKGWANPANIAKTHPVFSFAQNGDLVLRPPIGEEAAIRSRQGFGFGKGFILAARPVEPGIEVAKAEKRLRLAENREAIAAQRAAKNERLARQRSAQIAARLAAQRRLQPGKPKAGIAKKAWNLAKRTRRA